MQYLVILLDDTSVPFCHVENPLKTRNLMPIETLKKAILFGMKQNLMIQYVYPEQELPAEYDEVIESIDHLKIGRDVKIYNSVPVKIEGENVVLRLKIAVFIEKTLEIALLLPQVVRLNICLTDIETFADSQIESYKNALKTLNSAVLNQYKQQRQPQINISTDLLNLTEMHNCGAGVSNITIAPNGKFYLCPAFYFDEKTGVNDRMNHAKPTSHFSVGDLEKSLEIPNPQLLKLDHAPLCRNCDAYHCNRCIWLNHRLTWDNNTPSRQQCLVAHLERNATRELQQNLKALGLQTTNEIKEIAYLDPFDVRKEW